MCILLGIFYVISHTSNELGSWEEAPQPDRDRGLPNFRIVCPEATVLICILACWLDMREAEVDKGSQNTS